MEAYDLGNVLLGAVSEEPEIHSSAQAERSYTLPVLPSMMFPTINQRKPSLALAQALNAELAEPGPSRRRLTRMSTTIGISEENTVRRRSIRPSHLKPRSKVGQLVESVTPTGTALEARRVTWPAYEAKEEVSEPRELIKALRELPAPMCEKRAYKREFLKVFCTMPRRELAKLRFESESSYEQMKQKLRNWFRHCSEKVSLWPASLKKIEGRFGTAVVSYFFFLRWLFKLNCVMFLLTFIFILIPSTFQPDLNLKNIATVPTHDFFASSTVMNLPNLPQRTVNSTINYNGKQKKFSTLPNVFGSKGRPSTESITELGSLLDVYTIEGFIDATALYGRHNLTFGNRRNLSTYCEHIYEEYVINLTKVPFLYKVQDVFQGSGWMEYTRLFMGFYDPVEHAVGYTNYSMALAFLSVLFSLVAIILFMMLSYASEGVQEAVMGGLKERYCFIVFIGWNYCISDPKAAKLQHHTLYQEFLSVLSEERRKAAVKEWSYQYKLKIYAIRGCANLASILLLIAAYFLIFYVTALQALEKSEGYEEGVIAFVTDFLPPLTITILNLIFPLFVMISIPYEKYSLRRELTVILSRIIVLRLASIVIMVSSFYSQVTCEPRDMCGRGYENCDSPLCWETYVGQQMYRLAVMDLVVHFCIVFFWETPRNYAVRKWKNKFTERLGQQIFDIPSQVLAVVYSQTVCWLGMFYCPLLPGITVIKIVLFFYMKKFTVLKNCAPQQIAYRASRSNTIFVLILMISFFITVCVLGYSVTQIEPSPGCSPFRLFNHMTHAITDSIEQTVPELNSVLYFIFSPLFIIPLTVLLCLTLYYYVTKTYANKKMVKLLKIQLTLESKDKQFLIKRVCKQRRKIEAS